MEITDLPEIGLLIVIVTIALITSGTSTFKRYNEISNNQQLVDKNSSYEYGSLLNDKIVDLDDATDLIINTLLSCDSDKLSNVTVRFLVNGEVTLGETVMRQSIASMKLDINNIIGKINFADYTDITYSANIKFNVVYLDIYATKE